jgi:hypothetical protein
MDDGLVFEAVEELVCLLENHDARKKEIYAEKARLGLDKNALAKAVSAVRKAKKNKGHSPFGFRVEAELASAYVEAYLREDATRFGVGDPSHAHTRETVDMAYDPQEGAYSAC